MRISTTAVPVISGPSGARRTKLEELRIAPLPPPSSDIAPRTPNYMPILFSGRYPGDFPLAVVILPSGCSEIPFWGTGAVH